MKYSINGTGNIVAKRDIYSLGGFIPKGNVGGKIASEAQLSQDGECWLAGGDISTRPDIVIKDNAYVGTFTPADVTAAKLVIEFVPTPRIVVPYGTSGITITGMKIRMYDNAVLSKNINTPEELILKGDAVVSHLPGGCVCGWGDSDAIVKL